VILNHSFMANSLNSVIKMTVMDVSVIISNVVRMIATKANLNVPLAAMKVQLVCLHC
jgi:hypothetical protein